LSDSVVSFISGHNCENYENYKMVNITTSHRSHRKLVKHSRLGTVPEVESGVYRRSKHQLLTGHTLVIINEKESE
jgi:hypothetical protein